MLKSKLSLFLGTSAMVLGSFIFIVACHKKDTTTTTSSTEDTGYAADQVTAEKSYSDAESISNVAANTPNGSLGYRTTETTIGGCATVTHSGDTITVNFGSTDCVCADGRTRRGEIIIVYSGAYSDSGSTHTITFSDYYQDDNAITGTKTVTNMGHNSSGQPYFNVTINGTFTNHVTGAVSTVSWTRVRTWTAGSTTSTWTDDVYSISGSGSMVRTTTAGVSTTVDVAISTTNPLIVAYSCRWIEGGTITYTIASTGATRSIDYGSSSAPVCNNTATLTWAGGSIVITLP